MLRISRSLHDAGTKHRLGELLAQHEAAGNLLGRQQIVQEVFRKTGKHVPLATSSRLHVRFDDLDAPATGSFSFDLPAEGAAAYLRQLTPVTRETYDGLTAQYRRDAFTVAGTSDLRLIQKIRDELADVLQEGGTPQDFEKAVAKLTSDAGVQQINAFTLDNVFAMKMQAAYGFGRYEQQMDPDTVAVLPYGMYMTLGDDHVRPAHADLNGFIAQMVDPVWRKIYPPNDFGCRCIRVALLPDEVPDDADADTPGYARLPLLARLNIPGRRFTPIFGALAA